jgi:thioredoxin-related protein
MKKIVMFLLMSTLMFAEGYKEFAKEMSYETEYKTALNKAKKEGKNLMVLMITNYCPWCTKFEKKTLSDKNVDNAVKSKYIPLIINKEEGDFPKYLSAPMVPAVFFVEPNKEEILHQSVGFSNKTEFLNLLQKLK